MGEAVKYPDIHVELTREDGNVFHLAGTVGRAMRRAKVPAPEIEEFYEEVKSSQSYSDALATMTRWVDVS